MDRKEYNEVQSSVKSLFSRANAYNDANSVRRFYRMAQHKDGKLVEYGLYDYQTKKHVLFDIYSREQSENLAEFEQFLNDMEKIPVVK